MNSLSANVTVDKKDSSAADKWLWWLATAEPSLISQCRVDRNRYRIIGLTVMCTWLFASLAWSYFFFTVSDSVWVSLLCGAFMGFVILCIDRALIKGLNGRKNMGWASLLVRLALAVTIGLFMAQPAILFLFDKEVRMQASVDNEKRRMVKRQQLDSLYASQKQLLESQKTLVQQQIEKRYAEVGDARSRYLAETDGTGGSGKIGISNIALAKKAELDKLEKDFAKDAPLLQSQVAQADSGLRAIADTIAQREREFGTLLNDGFLTRIEALQNLVGENKALAMRYYLVVALLMMIELMPLISKMMMPSGTYDELVRLTEESEKQMRTAEAQTSLDFSLALLQTHRTENEKMASEMLAAAEPMRKAAGQEMLQAWRDTSDAGFAKWWKRLGRRIFFSTQA